MKRIQSFFVSYLVLLSPSLLAKTPMMATEIFKATQKALETKEGNFHCNHSAKAESSHNNLNSYTESFDADISCQISCKGKKQVSRTTKKRFSPTDHELFPGDGSSNKKIIWRSLGITLDTWSKVNCLEVAEKECGSREEVSAFEIEEVKSGTWSYKANLNCKSKEMIASPFDHEQQLSNHQKKLNSNSSSEDMFTSFYPPTFNDKKSSLYIHDLEESEARDLVSYDDKNDCKNPIKINSCFGDCIWVEEGKTEWTETLSTPEFLGDASFSICADKHISKISNKAWSKDVKKALCEQFVWEVIRKSHAAGESCAALRLDADCSQL